MTAFTLFPESQPRHVSMWEIKRKVAVRYRITADALESESRIRAIAWPRQVAMLLARDLARLSLPTIGRELRRDHTTVIHGLRSIEKRRAQDPGLDEDIAALTRELTQPVPERAAELQLAMFDGPLFDFTPPPPATRQKRESPDFEGHGVRRSEQRILDRRTAGMKPADIARELGLKRSYVRSVIGKYRVSDEELWQVSARIGTERLLQAIQKHHPAPVL